MNNRRRSVIIPVIILVLTVTLISTSVYLLLTHFPTTTQPVNTTEASIEDHLSKEEYMRIDNELSETTRKTSPQVALQKLETLMNIDPKVVGSCHGFVHDIGHAALTKYKDFSVAMSYQDDICGSGYIHGVIESYFKSSPNLRLTMNTVCNLNGVVNNKSCYHGVGHGIMYYNGNDLPNAITLCDTYPSALAKISCSEGVFMENFNSESEFHPTKFLKQSDPFFPCGQQTIFYKQSCYFYAPDYYLHLHGQDFMGAMKWCLTAEKGFITNCSYGVGSRTMKQNIGNPLFVEKVCSSTREDQVAPCIDGMVSYFLVNYRSLTRARTVCNTLKEEHIRTCLQSVAKRSTEFPA